MNDNVLMDLNTLDKNCWETSGTRFNAADRLAQQARYSLWAGAALNVAAITLAAATMVQPSPVLTMLAMLASVGALAFALTEAAAGHGVRSERMHANALAIRALMRALPERTDPAEATAEYNALLAQCPDNHSSVDWRLFHARKAAPGWRTETRYAILAYGWRWVLIAVALAGAVAVPFLR